MILVLLVFLAFITPFYFIYKPPSLLFRYFERRWPDVLFRVSTKDKIVALTIDDAPSHYTAQILSILEENNSTATFFVIGSQVPGREATLKEIVQNGNELGNHAMRDEASRSLSDVELETQISSVQRKIEAPYRELNLPPPLSLYFRPGSGFFSEKMRTLLQKMKYRLVLGNIYPHDAQIPYVSVNAAHILSMVKPGGIIICHDRRSWTVPMLKKVIPELTRRGYRITTVSGLLEHAGLLNSGSST
ncbi:carbohydrate esterase family 4 protein [Sporormia fimetaria CBS 119925]|uniref:chitin deacetylase n=1 Tax=Sporormia fimetaria CBS 119925 TaxID=1340428 RepID=A0A6A6UUN1_9PLEO|nr:carbohydrate esterase family 4 protein [Sporormia fimetaria CBS 119925]